MSPSIPDDRGYLRFRVSISRQNLGQLGNSKIPDILAFTETQLLPNDGDNEIRKNLQPFALFRQDHQRDKFMSLAVCTKDYIQITERKYFSSINVLKFVITNLITSILMITSHLNL